MEPTTYLEVVNFSIAVSTCWQSPVAQSGRDLIAKLQNLGIGQIELEYRISPEMFIELKPALTATGIQAVSIHNFFPAPTGATQPGPRIWAFTSPDAEERKSAVDHTKAAIEVAGEIGAKALVVHCGQIDMNPRTDDLFRLFDAGEIDSPVGRRVVGELQTERESKIGQALERVSDCLESLAATAQRAGVKVGLENRYYANEVPNSEDLSVLFDNLGNGWLGYWHDVGHAAVQEQLGLDSQASLLGRYRDKTIGAHLHDVRGYHDHLAPGTGEVDFAFIKENLPPDIIKVVEVRPSVTKTQLLAGLDHLKGVGIC